MYDSLLVATDGSEDGARAVEHAVWLADRLEVPLHGVAVLETRTEYDNAIVDPDEVRRSLRTDAEGALAAVAVAADDAGVEVETELREGVPHEEILDAAADHGVSAIVVGARGRSSFRRALLGSTVDAVVRLAPVPVLVVGEE